MGLWKGPPNDCPSRCFRRDAALGVAGQGQATEVLFACISRP